MKKLVTLLFVFVLAAASSASQRITSFPKTLYCGEGGGLLHPTNAVQMATAGTTIIVLSGNYSMGTLTSRSLLKDRVHWHFMEGAKVTLTISGADGGSYALFDDRHSGAATSIITGALDIVCSVAAVGADPIAAAFYIQDANSVVYFQCNSVSLTDPTGNGAFSAMKQRRGYVVAIANKIFDPNIATSDADGVYWSGGKGVFITYDIVMSGLAVNFQSPIASSDEGFLFANYIEGGDVGKIGSHAVLFGNLENAANTNFRGWIICNEVHSKSGGAVRVYGAGKFYLNAQKVGVSAGTQPAIEFGGAAFNGANAWINVEKITGFGGPIIKSASYTGTAKIRTQDLEDASAATIGVDWAAGNLRLNGAGDMKILNGKGISFSGGNAIVKGLNIDCTATTSTNNRCVHVTAAGLTLQDCVLFANASHNESFFSATALNSKIYGTVDSNKDANTLLTTFTVGGIDVDAQVAP